MSDTQLQRVSGDSYAVPHQLCRCCRKFSEAFAQMYPTMQEEEERVCPRYDSLQDLVDGAQGGCHLCILAIESIKRESDGRNKDHPLWLQLARKTGSSEDSVPEMILSTYVLELYGSGHTSVYLEIESPAVGSKEQTTYSSSIRVNPHDKSSAPELISPEWVRGVQLSKQLASDEHYRLIQKWLDECKDEAQHPACNADETFRRPTRLLDLTYHDEDVKLVMGDTNDRPYAALSYCWGLAPQLMLLRSNLLCFQDRIPLASLSKVSQDAITVCRKLCIPYLWVDALCIVQGDDGDFLSEAPRMQDVYAGSIFTVVAASSKDTTEPFLIRREPLGWISCDLGPAEKNDIADYEMVVRSFCKDNEPGGYPIDSRAWYLQERLMSPRSIYFGNQGIHWECRRGVACEIFPEINTKHTNGKLRPFFNRLPSLKSDYAELQSIYAKEISKVPRAREIWNDLLAAYTKMALSYSNDRLIAIAGIASIFESKFKWASTYGLWIDSIIRELLWFYPLHIPRTEDRAPTGHLPSWSWTSTNGQQVSTNNPRRQNHEMDDNYMATPVSWPSDSGFNTSLQDSPKDKRLCIRGYLIPCNETSTGLKSSYAHMEIESRSDRFHYRDRIASETDLYCLLLACDSYVSNGYKRYENYGLVLTPVNLTERCYRRTGVIEEFHTADDFPDAPDTQFVQGKFLTDLWAPVGEEQEIFII